MNNDQPFVPDPPSEPAETGASFESAPPEIHIAADPLPIPPPRYVPEDLSVPWGWFDLMIFVFVSVGIVLLLFVLAVVAIMVISRGRPALAQAFGENLSVNILFMVILDFAIVGYLANHIRSRFHAPFWRTIGWRPIEAGGVSRAMGLLALVGTGLFLNLVVAVVSAAEPPKTELPIDKLFQDRHAALLFMLVAVALAPAIEETVFRGYLYPVFARSWGIAAGVIVTGILFGGMHAQQLWGAPWQIFSLVVVGVVLTAVRARTKSVLASFIVHTSYNSFQVLAVVISTHGLRNLPSFH